MDVATTARSWLRIVLSSALVALSAVALYARPPPEPRYLMVDEVVARAGELDGARLRVHGWVRPGSIHRFPSREIAFLIQRHGTQLGVHYVGSVPDTFKDQSEIVVVGTLRGGSIEAEQLLAKCATKYEADPQRDVTTSYK